MANDSYYSDPIGSGRLWFTNTPPPGYIILDGSVISRTTYAALFAVWGTAFGAGDGSTTFGIPDMRQRVPIGKKTAAEGGHADTDTVGKTGGSFNHVHSMQSHTHALQAHTHTMANHQHTTAATSAGDHQHNLPATSTGNAGGAGNPASVAAGTDHNVALFPGHTHGYGGAAVNVSPGGSHTHPAAQTTAISNNTSDGATTTGAANGPSVTDTGSGNQSFFVVNYIVRF